MSKPNNIHIDFHLSKGEMAAVIILATVVVILAVYETVAHTSLRYLIPGYPDPDERLEIAQNAIILDSLQRSIFRWELYSGNLRKILEGGKPEAIDELYKRADDEYSLKESQLLAATDSSLRAEITEIEKLTPAEPEPVTIHIEDMNLKAPASGKIDKKFDSVTHPGIDISAKEGTAIKAVADGTVVYTDCNDSGMWSLILQHGNGLISIYKNAGKIEKQAGDPVSIGKTIATLGNQDSKTGNPALLHFELWLDGEPLNPTDYIKFK